MNIKKFSKLMIMCLLFSILIGYSYSSAIKIVVKVDNAKIRFESSFESSVVATVEKDTILKSDKKEGEWYSVTLEKYKSGFNVSGYIHENDVELFREVSALETSNIETPNKTDKSNISREISEPEKIKSTAPSYLKYSESGKITYTTTDLVYPYEIVGIVACYQEFGTLTIKDPLERAIEKGMKKFEKRVIDKGGDAVVGLRFNFASRTSKDEGRLLIYGTVVKFR